MGGAGGSEATGVPRGRALLCEAFHVPGQSLDEGGVDFGENGEDLVADLVALEVAGGVGAVFAPGEIVFGGEGFDFGPGHAQKGPQQGNIDIIRVWQKARGPHARDAFEARAAKKVQQQRFRVVVGIVRYRHGLVAMFAAQLAEPVVAQSPGRHLHGDAVFGRVGLCVEAFDP